MSTIKIEYLEHGHLALVSPCENCTDTQFSSVRRFLEERLPTLVVNRGRSISLPWWALLAIREGLKYVMRASGILSLDLSADVKQRLAQARAQATSYSNTSEEQCEYSQEDLSRLLVNVGFERILLPFQSTNVDKLYRLGAGASFSVPGAGKTTEALAYFFLTRSEEDRLLVIAPKNAFMSWEDEIKVCAPTAGYEFERLIGGKDNIVAVLNKCPRAVIISYHQLPRVLSELGKFLSSNSVYCFVDESHRMKRGMEGVHGHSILMLSHLPKRKLILSGTPMPNAVDDLVPQFQFLYPQVPVTKENVVERLKTVFVRTTKSSLGLLPPVRIKRDIPMNDAQERLYQVLASDAARHLEGLSVSDRLRFRRFACCVQYMLQASSNPSLLLSTSIADNKLLRETIKEGLSAKLTYACDLARTLVSEGKKVLIWSGFVGTVEHLAEMLADIGAHYIHGGVETSDDDENDESRESKIREFNDRDSNCRVLVANPAACSEGISLHHVCHHAIYVDRNYNAAHYLQSEDRIHRIGLAPDVRTFITVLCSPGTIDESVGRRLEAKVAAMQAVLDDPDLSISPLNLDLELDEEGLDSADLSDLRTLLGVQG